MTNSGFIAKEQGNGRLTKEEIQKYVLNAGHEVAVHGHEHRAPGKVRPIEVIADVLQCRTELENMFGRMMLYDYIKFTGDISYSNVSVGDSTILEQAVKAIETLSKCADETCLLYKEGKYNMRDWADEVCRYGYVTYDEILYAKLMLPLTNLLKVMIITMVLTGRT